MADDGWLTKSEVNALYYKTVGGEIVFATEAQASLHTDAVARLISLQAERCGAREIRILELGANNCAFARSLLKQLKLLARGREQGLTRIDYLAVEYAREALEAAAATVAGSQGDERLLRPRPRDPSLTGPELVALVTTTGPTATNLGLVNAEAGEYVESSTEMFDFAIANELLDDLPYRAFFAGDDGQVEEIAAHARGEEHNWRVRVGGFEPGPGAPEALPPATLTARSVESVALVEGVARLLRSGGLLLLHDYGYGSEFPSLSTYEPPPRSLPVFAALEFPEGSEQGFPRSFFRVFGNEQYGLVQITNDVNFAELASALSSSGCVVTLAHGNAIANQQDFSGFTRADGVFLSEFGLLTPGDDLGTLFERLEREQVELRARYVAERAGGRDSIFQDLIYLKG